ncbi:hypothetical protein BSKO_11435 [Bryopsis sp. KO-2023]|nr:hypothetical protein BSKO_11435 [Bryopsis sp. KO-2023]
MTTPEEQVGKMFVEHYYNAFDTNRAALASLYQPDSYLTFEGKHFVGTQAIMEKLTSLPFARCAHQLDTLDVQRSPTGGLLVFTTGALKVEGEANPMRFSQTFHLSQVGSNWVVTNDMFRLNLSG